MLRDSPFFRLGIRDGAVYIAVLFVFIPQVRGGYNEGTRARRGRNDRSAGIILRVCIFACVWRVVVVISVNLLSVAQLECFDL